MVEKDKSNWLKTIQGNSTEVTEESKWTDNDIEQLSAIKSSIDKIKEEKQKAEDKIYNAIKEFEWSTGIKIVKIDFEISRENMNSRVKIVLERI